MTTLENLIRQHIPLPARQNNRGWFSVVCKVCNDHGRKGPRAGFRFDNGQVGFNCFNCGHTAIFDPEKHEAIPKDMKVVLEAFGIPPNEYNLVLLAALRGDASHGTRAKHNEELEPKQIELPRYFTPLSDHHPDDEWANEAEMFLLNRSIYPHSYPFHVCSVYFEDDKESRKWYGRLIIPVYKDDKLVFFQGRDISDEQTRVKYLSPPIPKDNIIYGYEKLNEEPDLPLYITEGFFDAFVINGVSVFGPKMTDLQIAWLNRTRRKQVVVPDQFGDGWRLAEQAVELGWSVATPEIGDCKDINDAVIKYGLIYVLKSLRDNTYEGIEAQARIKRYCQDA